jgi:hypothetical protein
VLAARLLAVQYVALLDELWAPLVAGAIMGSVLVGVAEVLPTSPALLTGALLESSCTSRSSGACGEAVMEVSRRIGALRRQRFAKS